MMGPSDPPEEQAVSKRDQAEFAQFALENLFAISPDAILVTDGSGTIGRQIRVQQSYSVTHWKS